jgi:hypothetical protein
VNAPPPPSVLDALPLPEADKVPPPHGVLGFRLPIAPEARPKKWTRQWCASGRAREG